MGAKPGLSDGEGVGIHYRESAVKGVNLGRKVAYWTLQRYFLPEN